jgi:hypothetical protein
MSANYSSILNRAWNITWKHKVLWFFGFLAMLGGGSSGIRSANVNFSFESRQIETTDMPPEWQNVIDQLNKIPINTWINIVVGFACLLFFLWLCLWILSVIGQGGLIGGILKADDSGGVNFREAWGRGAQFFWRLLGIRLLKIVMGLVFAIFVLIPGVCFGIMTCGLGFLPLICGAILLGVVLNLWFLLMDYAVVVENQGLGEAFGRAWNILRDHIGPIIILYLILLAASLGVGLVLMILLSPAAAAIFLSVVPLIFQAGPLNVTLLEAGLVLLVISLPVCILINSVYTVWEAGVWTFAYQAFIGRQQTESTTAVNPEPAASTIH